jgi:predicted nucleic acid-binding protein
MELTVRPYRIKQPEVAAQYEALLSRFPNMRMADVTQNIARKAAQLRGTYSLSPVDALHMATCLTAGATAWITNDQALRRLIPLIDVIVLDDFLKPAK